MSDQQREFDDLHEAFESYRRPPKDVVPYQPRDDLPPIPTGNQPYTYAEITEHGVTRHTGTAHVTEPFNAKGTTI